MRPATREDVPVVAALETDLFGPDAWSASTVEEELTGARRWGLVVESEGRVVGYVAGLDGGDTVDLTRIAVASSHRRRGLATELMMRLQGEARTAGALRMMLEVSADNQDALAFYTRLGFEEVDRRRRYYRDGSDAVVMSVELGGGGS